MMIETEYEEDILYDLPLSTTQVEVDEAAMWYDDDKSGRREYRDAHVIREKMRTYSDCSSGNGVFRTHDGGSASTSICSSVAKRTYAQASRQLVDAECGGEQRNTHKLLAGHVKHGDGSAAHKDDHGSRKLSSLFLFQKSTPHGGGSGRRRRRHQDVPVAAQMDNADLKLNHHHHHQLQQDKEQQHHKKKSWDVYGLFRHK